MASRGVSDSMKTWLTCCSLGILILLLTASTAWAQATAQLNGTVRDESGAVLPGVTVTVTQTNTGLVRSTVTDETGAYLLTTLPTGPYRLEASLQGFKSYVQTGIVLQVGGTPTVNAVLAVGTLEESVTVEAAAPLVDVRSAGISSVVDTKAILELPLQGRQVTDLIMLAGAAAPTGGTNGNGQTERGVPGGVYISVAGGLPGGVAYTLDGAEHNNPQSNVGLPMPFPDALQEFQVATSGLTAENGVKSGASVNAVTKSGTNAFHGGGFEFLRDRRFNAPEHFAAIGPDGKQKDDGLRRNQFGGTLGGPIVHDKLFFFCRLPGHHPASGADEQHFIRADRPDARRRLHDDRLTGVQRRETDQPGRPVCREPHRSGASQPRGEEGDRAPANDHRSVWPGPVVGHPGPGHS
jgi:hypothetical protein